MTTTGQTTLASLHGQDRQQSPSRVIELHGFPVHALTEAQVIHFVLSKLDAGYGGWMVPTNLDVLRQFHRDPEVAGICSEASLFVADGARVGWASWLQGTPLPGRVAGSTLISQLSAEAASRGRSIFLLGGDEGTAEAAGDALRRRCPSLVVSGCLCPPLGFEHDPPQMATIEAALRSAAPDIVFVALGFPKQERLIKRLKDRFPQTWWIGVGISFSFLSGRVKRAPYWMQRTGLEWVHRLAQEPRRLSRRYLRNGIPFAVQLLASSAWRGLHRTSVVSDAGRH